jgi:hypothetical protein
VIVEKTTPPEIRADDDYLVARLREIEDHDMNGFYQSTDQRERLVEATSSFTRRQIQAAAASKFISMTIRRWSRGDSSSRSA